MDVELRNTGIDAVAEVPWGTHLCLFYENEADLLDIMAGFFAAGLESGELCLWVLSPPITEDDAWAALAKVLPDTDRYRAEGRIALLPHHAWYLTGGRLDLDAALKRWKQKTADALARGYAGMRAGAQTAWLQREAWRDFCAYEEALSRAIAGDRSLILCAYPVWASDAALVLDVARSHQTTVAKRLGRWEVLESAELRAAKAEVRRLHGLEQARGERYRAQIRELAEASVAMNALGSVDEVLRAAAARAGAIIGTEQALASLVWDGPGPQVLRSFTVSAEHAGFSDAADGVSTWTALVCRSNQPIRITAADAEARAAAGQAGGPAGVRGWLAAPLISRAGRNLGAIEVAGKIEGDFGATDEAMLVQLAHMASGAIENARLFAQVQRGRARLRRLSRDLVKTQEDERRRIARELHDEIGQALTALKLNLQTVEQAAGEDVPGLQESVAIAERALAQARDLSLGLRPSILDDLGLVAALRWYLNGHIQRAGIATSFTSKAVDERLPVEIETVCFRLAQEALTNIVRHARATRVAVDLHASDGVLHLTIRDDGIGFDVTAARRRARGGQSLGLLSMHERVGLVDGRLEIRSAPAGGTEVHAWLPIARAGASQEVGAA
ncbi:MAG: MEDS domain-containing protein [Candidatus Binatia bacterium]